MRIRTLALAAVAATVAVVGMALPAGATKDGRCDSGDGCLYYNSNRGGSLIDYRTAISNFGGDRFISSGPGRALLVKNNAASAMNRYAYAPLYIYYNENYTGPFDKIPASSWGNLVHTRNDNASMKWCATGCP